MLKLILALLLISLVAGWFGYTRIADTSSGVAKFLFFLLIIGLIITVVLGMILIIPLLTASALVS